jgi:SAM-dependent methyltransferase
MNAPTTSQDFDREYAAPLTVWGDWRIPGEIKRLVAAASPLRVLELGCGVGRVARYLAAKGHHVTAVDFSPLAIDKARARVAADAAKPEFLVDDVRALTRVDGPFDLAVDVGCFHCLDEAGRRGYGSAVSRVLAPGATLLMWGMEDAPSRLPMDAAGVGALFGPSFALERSVRGRRRLVLSYWHWLRRC